ncbi:MAG: transposase [Anaerolineales bacterium]|nr:transposase [Anaerolineales bacterium]
MPVNVLVGLEALKSGFGRSDAELYEQFLYNLQVRYAPGYSRPGEGEFELRTLYHFRQRLSRYRLTHGVNLPEQAFEAITDRQRVALPGDERTKSLCRALRALHYGCGYNALTSGDSGR